MDTKRYNSLILTAIVILPTAMCTGAVFAQQPSSNDSKQTIKVCSKIGIELRNKYMLGYHSANEAKDGRWRKIRLKVNPPKGLTGLSVHARNGYYAAKLNVKP